MHTSYRYTYFYRIIAFAYISSLYRLDCQGNLRLHGCTIAQLQYQYTVPLNTATWEIFVCNKLVLEFNCCAMFLQVSCTNESGVPIYRPPICIFSQYRYSVQIAKETNTSADIAIVKLIFILDRCYSIVGWAWWCMHCLTQWIANTFVCSHHSIYDTWIQICSQRPL